MKMWDMQQAIRGMNEWSYDKKKHIHCSQKGLEIQ
jgi:hypothetical protein